MNWLRKRKTRFHFRGMKPKGHHCIRMLSSLAVLILSMAPVGSTLAEANMAEPETAERSDQTKAGNVSNGAADDPTAYAYTSTADISVDAWDNIDGVLYAVMQAEFPQIGKRREKTIERT